MDPRDLVVVLYRVDDAEVDEMWSYVVRRIGLVEERG
jgi:hypothetical protein